MNNNYERGNSRPPQNIPLKEKLKNDNWVSDCHDYYVSKAYLEQHERDDMLFAYEIVNGKISPDKHKHYFGFVENPYNTDRPELKGYPAQMRDLSIIRPNVELLRGSFRQMPQDYQVKVVSDSSITLEDEMKKNKIKQILTNIVASMIEGREDSAYPNTVELGDLKDERAAAATIALQRIKLRERVSEKLSEIFFDFIVAGRASSLKEYTSGKVYYTRTSPFDTHVIKSENTRFFEDGEAAIIYEKLTMSEILERYHDDISSDKEILDALDLESGSLYFSATTAHAFDYSRYRDYQAQADNFLVSHCYWKSTVEEYIIGYYDEMGQYQERVEQETEKGKYKVQEGEEIIETYRIPVVWQSIKVHTELSNRENMQHSDGFIIKSGILEAQMEDALNPARLKLPVNGIDYSNTYTKNTSPVRLMIPYEILYRIIWWRLEFTIAKNRGKFVLMDMNAIPNGEGKEGWDSETFFYNAETMSIGLLDRSQPSVDRTWNQYQVVDLSMYEHVVQYIELLNFIKSEADAILGITPPRKGIMKSTDTATGVQTSNIQSAIISEEIYSRFGEFVERELAGLLDLSRYEVLYDGNLVGASEEEKQLVQVDGLKYFSSSYSLFVTSSSKDSRALENYKALAQEYAQNGATPETIADIITSESMSQVKKRLQQAQKKIQEAQANQIQQEQAANQQTEQAKAAAQAQMKEIEKEFKIMENALEIEKLHEEWNRKDQNEHIKGSYNIASFQGTLDVNENKVPDSVEIQKGLTEQQKVANDAQLKSRELDIKEKEIKSKEKIESLKAETALKNKVSGEK